MSGTGEDKDTGVSDMLGISSSWQAMKGLSIKDSVEKIFGLGFDLVELGAAHRYEEKAAETVMDLRKRYPDKKFTLHALFPPVKTNSVNSTNDNKNGSKNHGNIKGHHYVLNLADSKEHEATIKCVRKMFDVSDMINGEMIGIHGGFAGEVRFVEGDMGFEDVVMKKPIPTEEARRNMTLIIQELVNMAEERGTRLAIEVHQPGDFAPIMITPEAFEWLFSNFKSKYLGMLLDIGHLHAASREGNFDPFDFIRRFKKKIFELHLHDYRQKEGRKDHFPVGTGEIDFKKYFRTIGRARLRKIPLVFEYNNTVTEQQALEGKALIEKLLK